MAGVHPLRRAAIVVATIIVPAWSAPNELLAALNVRHFNGWSTAGGQIEFNAASEVFSGVDPNAIDYWNQDQFYLWQPVAAVAHNYGVEWSGYVRIDQPGQYGFGTISDDGSEVWIDGVRIVENQELQWYDWEDNVSEGNTSGESFPPLNLSTGYHPITVRFYEQFNFAGIELWWLKPGAGTSDIPYYGTNFHGLAPTYNPNTNWEIVPASGLFTVPPFLPGDYNINGRVDAADYTVWRNGDSPDSTQAGYNLWRANFGKSTGSGTALAAIPEPSTLLLTIAAVAALGSRRRRPANGQRTAGTGSGAC